MSIEDQVIAAAAHGTPYREIAHRLGLTERQVWRVIRDHQAASHRIDHERLTAEQLEAGFQELGLTPVEFRHLTGAGRNSIRSWLAPSDAPKSQEPPFWVTSWLALYSLPGGREMAAQVAERYLIKGDDDEAGTDT